MWILRSSGVQSLAYLIDHIVKLFVGHAVVKGKGDAESVGGVGVQILAVFQFIGLFVVAEGVDSVGSLPGGDTRFFEAVHEGVALLVECVDSLFGKAGQIVGGGEETDVRLIAGDAPFRNEGGG